MAELEAAGNLFRRAVFCQAGDHECLQPFVSVRFAGSLAAK